MLREIWGQFLSAVRLEICLVSGVLCAVCCVCVVFNMKEKHVNAALKSNQVTHGGGSRSHGAFWDQNLHFISISNISTQRYFMSHNLSLKPSILECSESREEAESEI